MRSAGSEAPAPRLCYEHADVEKMLGYLFHGGEQWSRDDVPDADMPKAKANPAMQGTHMAAMVDMQRAVACLIGQGRLRNPAALWLYHATGATQKAIGRRLGLSQQAIQEALAVDELAVRDAMNEGLRPGKRGGLWPSKEM